ncbi:MAG: hypothetical protein AAGJ35_11255 [Myxococcota bacterium]
MPEPVETITNGGIHTIHQIGDFNVFGGASIACFYDPNAVGNLLAVMVEHFHVTMNSDTDKSFRVHHHSGRTLCFGEWKNGLYLLLPRNTDNLDNSNTVSPYSAPHLTFLTTVADQEAKFTKRKIQGAK